MPWHGRGRLRWPRRPARNEAPAAGGDRHQPGAVGAGVRGFIPIAAALVLVLINKMLVKKMHGIH